MDLNSTIFVMYPTLVTSVYCLTYLRQWKFLKVNVCIILAELVVNNLFSNEKPASDIILAAVDDDCYVILYMHNCAHFAVRSLKLGSEILIFFFYTLFTDGLMFCLLSMYIFEKYKHIVVSVNVRFLVI